ncbi:hypothetical protein HU200_061913 [Digitaria exilis]|uniref:UDP-glucuronate 4-epimerase n=1 Tax=Digitaria exilis TaxID=1010633 RepID=A0A835AGB5_9POAL|nr:hypothetical protein HU200_061913 [Digitaria exilis]
MPAGVMDAAAKGVRLDRPATILLRRASGAKQLAAASSHLLFRATILATLALVVLFAVHYPSLLSRSFSLSSSSPSSSSSPHRRSSHRSLLGSSTYSGAAWEREVRRSATPRRNGGLSVLVTGAAGFVGAHCSVALHARGDGVVGLDNFNSYYDVSLKRARHRLLLSSHGVVVLDADINDAALLERLFAAVPFTHVLHLAAQAGVRYAMKAPQAYVASNVAGLVGVFEAAARHADPQPAIVWASSSSVYGLNGETPFSEDHRTDRPASLYAATKKAGEAIAHAYNHIYGLSITGLRFFTVYGPWGRPDMAYFSFARAIVSGEPITLFADARRDFTYIDDVVRGCLGALDTAGKSTGSKSGKKSGPAPLRVYNLGNTSPVPVTRMVTILEKLLGKKAHKRVVTMPTNGDVPFTHANVSHAARDFGYRPTTSLEVGLRHFVEWFVKYYKLDDIKGGSSNVLLAAGKTTKRKKSMAMSAAS